MLRFDPVKVALNVRIYDKVVPPVARFPDRFQGLCRTPLRSESITAWLEIRFKDRFDH
jgi:hypothetical protein